MSNLSSGFTPFDRVSTELDAVSLRSTGLDAEAAVKTLLRLVGRDPDTEDGVRDTPRRVVQALTEMTCGRFIKPEQVLGTTFEVQHGDQMVVLANIPFISLCEHHILVFHGTVDIGYLPEQIEDSDRYRVVGLSKLARLVDCLAGRLQLQERLTAEISDALMTHLKARGAAVVIRAVHSCMCHRGVKKPGAEMVTSSMQGAFLTDFAARSEFFTLCRG